MVFILVIVNVSWLFNINLVGYLRNSGYFLEKLLILVLNLSNFNELVYKEVYVRILYVYF